MKRISVVDSYRYCERITYGHYENFPVASFLIPRDKRKHVAAVYAFARIADDYADEPGFTPEARLQKLQDWKNQLKECYRGSASHPVFVALGRSAEEFEIPEDLFQRLLKAFVSDVSTHRYKTFADVLAYCENSANPVGRLVLLLFGYKSGQLEAASDRVCTALQLTNFWQDLSVDLARDRVYVPLEDLEQFGLTVQELKERKVTQPFRNLIEFEVRRTSELFDQGKSLLSHVGRDLALELRLTWLGGNAILKKIRKKDYDVLRHRPTLSLAEKSLLLFRAFRGIPNPQ